MMVVPEVLIPSDTLLVPFSFLGPPDMGATKRTVFQPHPPSSTSKSLPLSLLSPRLLNPSMYELTVWYLYLRWPCRSLSSRAISPGFIENCRHAGEIAELGPSGIYWSTAGEVLERIGDGDSYTS